MQNLLFQDNHKLIINKINGIQMNSFAKVKLDMIKIFKKKFYLLINKLI